MPSDFDIRPIVEKNSAMPFERLRIVRHFEELGLANIGRGIVFIFAAWSGPAMLALQRFTRVLNPMDTLSLDVVVLDTDCLTADSAQVLFGKEPGGWGEVIWIRDGIVVAREIARDGSDAMLAKHTKELLKEHTA